MTFRRAGFSLIETVMAVLILGGAMATVMSLISTSVHQMGQQKMQTSAVGFASGQMNRFLFEEPFENLATTQPKEVVVDGVWFQYTLDVVPVPNSEIKFHFARIPYHDPRHGAATATGAEPTVPTTVAEDRGIEQLDAKFTSGGPVLKDLKLTVKWHGPYESYDDDNSLKLLTRRARI